MGAIDGDQSNGQRHDLDEVLIGDGVDDPLSETVCAPVTDSAAAVVVEEEETVEATVPATVPEKIGRYQIRGTLGTGSFGAVYLGYDGQLDRQVAIKVPLLKMSTGQEQLFLQEPRQLAQLKHPGIVTVHDVGVDKEICYIVSEYLKGQDLAVWMRDHRPGWKQTAEIMATLADALATTHSQSTVHRDIKPANVIMTERGEEYVPVLVDFGLALSESSASQSPGGRGQIAGTLKYMAPEQARGEGHRIDGRTDIYALGVVLYEMLSGQVPFSGPTVAELLQAVLSDEPRPPRQFVRGLPRELERICLKAMAKQIADRYTTAGDLVQGLRRVLRQNQDPLPSASSGSTAKDKPATREATRILIADDHELSRFKLQNDLEKWGHEVTAAEDGEEAWELFQKHQYSIVITDWMMPKMDGLELVHLIRAADSADYVYVIMLTAKAEKQDIVAGMGAGADDFLTKPFHRDELQVRVRAGIRITNLNRELNETLRRLQHSQEAAARIQRSCLPTVKPEIAGFDFAWDHQPCGELGGDMLNIVHLDEQHVGLYVLDVTGEGVPAALLATTLSRVMSPAAESASILVERSDDGTESRIRAPIDVARELNRSFGVQEGRQFFTLVYGVLNLESREFQFTSAGHPPVLHQQGSASPRMLDVDGFPIGMAPDSDDFHQRSVVLEPGDRLLIYSDGLPDTMNHDGEVFGAARLLEFVKNNRQESLNGLTDALMIELQAWKRQTESSGDVSVLAVEVS